MDTKRVAASLVSKQLKSSGFYNFFYLASALRFYGAMERGPEK